MYLTKQKAQSVPRRVRSEQKEMSLINTAKHEVGAALSFNEVCIQFSRTHQKEGTQQEILNQRFLELERRIMEIYSEEDRKAESSAHAIKLWKKLRHKPVIEDDLAQLEDAINAIPRKMKKERGTVQEMSSGPSNATADPNPKDVAASEILGKPDETHTYTITPCKPGSMLIKFLVKKRIIERNERVFIGHQGGHSRKAKRFVVVIRGKPYLIFTAQHPGGNNQEYEVIESLLPDLEYGIRLEGRRITFGDNGIELNDGRQI